MSYVAGPDLAIHRLPAALTRWPGYLMSFLAQHLTERFDHAMAPYGVASRHVSVMAVVDAEGPLSQREAGRRLQIDKSPMVGVIDDLEARGYAERRRSDTDRRVQAIHLTPTGLRVLRKAQAIADAENARLTAALDEDEVGQLQALLLRLSDSA